MKLIKNIFYILLLLTAAGCSGRKPSPAGNKVVSLSPAVTEIILALNGKAMLGGRSSACTMAEVADIPVAGDLGLPFAEPVLGCGAKTVLTDISAPGKSWDQLRKCGMNMVILPAEKLDDLPANVRAVGNAVNRSHEAETLAGELSGRLQQQRQTPPRRKFRTLVVISLPPVVTCGGNTFLHEALQLAGAENIAAAAGSRYFSLSTEFILHSDPELIISFLPREITEKFFSRNEFRNMSAIQKNRIIYPDPEVFCRLTPRLVQGIEELRSVLERDFRD